MQCPQCQAVLPDGTAICPKCDAILDTSFLGDEFGQPAAAPAPAAPPRAPAAAARPAARPARPAPARAPANPAYPPPAAAGYPPPAAGYPPPSLAPAAFPPPTVRPAAPPPTALPPAEEPLVMPAPEPLPERLHDAVEPEAAEQREVGTRIVQLDPEREKGTRIVQLPTMPPEVKEKRAAEAKGKPKRAKDGEGDGQARGRLNKLALEESNVSRDFDATLERIKLVYTKLDRIDRPLFYALATMTVACFLPWIDVNGEGMLAGIQDVFGAIATAAAFLGLGAFIVRAWRRLRGGPLVLLEIAGTLGVAAASVYRALTLNGRPLGLVLGVLAAAVAFLLGLVRLVK
ncbi:MAG TPA: hypothetical protein VGQ83_04540 [Polyangia bacterium]